MQAPTFTADCFFCEGSEDLINCWIVELDQNVHKMAEALGDSKLLAKLAEGDMGATSIIATQSPVVLTLGKSIFQACMHSAVDNVLIMADVARRVREVIFCNNQTFNGDISFESQASSVPNISNNSVN